MEWFVDDDGGYLAWLEAHPGGYVLNTFARPSASDLVLHRVSCGTLSRPLGDTRKWTRLYGKACSDERADLVAWAHARTGGTPTSCGICSPIPSRATGPATAAADSVAPVVAHGSRALRDGDCTEKVAYEGDPIRIVVSPEPDKAGGLRPPFIIEGAQWLAELFFRCDPSAVGTGSYDTHIELTQQDRQLRDHVVDADVTAVNRTMAARTSHARWEPIVKEADQAWLRHLGADWSLFELGESEWARAKPLLRTAFAAVRRPGIGLAVATKVLHIKRPALFPVLDSLVLEQVGSAAGEDESGWLVALERVREVGRANLAELRQIREHLRGRGLPDRTLVRILDAILWTSHPASVLYPKLSGWERVFRPSAAGGEPPRAGLS